MTAFVVGERHRRSTASAQVLVTALRSLLRFLFLEGHIARRLGDDVPGPLAPGARGEAVGGRFGDSKPSTWTCVLSTTTPRPG